MPTMAAANPILPKHGSLTFTDGTGSPISMVVPYTEAIDLGEFNDGGGQEFAVHRNRGAVIAVVPSGVITENVIKCKVRISALKHATDLNILDWVRRKELLLGPHHHASVGKRWRGDLHVQGEVHRRPGALLQPVRGVQLRAA